MRPFFDTTSGVGMDGDDGFRTKLTNAYLEVEWKIDDGYLVANFIPTNNHTLLLCANWGNNIDFINEMLQNQSDCELMAKTWPLLTDLLAAGVDERFSEGCLQRLNDPDTGNLVWMTCTLVGNLNLDDADDWLCDRVTNGCQTIFARSDELLNELNTREPDEFTHYGMQFLKAAGKVAARYAFASLFGFTYKK